MLTNARCCRQVITAIMGVIDEGQHLPPYAQKSYDTKLLGEAIFDDAKHQAQVSYQKCRAEDAQTLCERGNLLFDLADIAAAAYQSDGYSQTGTRSLGRRDEVPL